MTGTITARSPRIAIAIAVAAALATTAHSPTADAKGCHETSYVVGLEHCTWFGTWSRDAAVPRLSIDLGFFHHAYNSTPFALDQSARTTAPGDGFATTSNGLELRVVGGIGRVFYTGFELEPGGLGVMPHVPAPSPIYGGYFGMHAIAGAHVSLFRIGFATELATGFRYESFTAGSDKAHDAVSASQSRRELEARVRFDLFIVPRWSLGITLGRSLIDRDDTTLLLSSTIHMRALDGMW